MTLVPGCHGAFDQGDYRNRHQGKDARDAGDAWGSGVWRGAGAREDGQFGGALQVDPKLTPDAYGYRVRCIRIWGQIRTDVGGNVYGYWVRCGGAREDGQFGRSLHSCTSQLPQPCLALRTIWKPPNVSQKRAHIKQISGRVYYAVLVGGTNGDGAQRGMVTTVELIDPRPYMLSLPDLGG